MSDTPGEFAIYLAPFSHLDLHWLGEREECLSRGNRIIAAALAIARQHPHFRFLLEDMVFVDHFVACHPEMAPELRKQVQVGRIELGAKWAGIYQNMQDGEALVRNLLYGRRFVRDCFEVEPRTVHLGDLPGYTPQFPQLLASANIRGVVNSRGGPAEHVLYRWAALDGSTVLTWNALKGGYPWSWRKGLHRSVAEALEGGLDEEARRVAALACGPILMHWGVDLVVAPERLVQNLATWNRQVNDLPMTFATPSEYFDAVALQPSIATLSGEIHSVWPHLEPSFPDILAPNPAANFALVEGEIWAELARRLGFSAPPPDLFADAWKMLLEGMDHNSGGTGAEASDRRHREYVIRARLTGEEARRRATRIIAENVRLPDLPDLTPIVVFNSTSWLRTEVVTAHASFYGEVESFSRPDRFGDPFRRLRLFDHNGQEVRFQTLEQKAIITREATICFIAQDVPAFGYKLFYLLPAQENASETPCCQMIDTDATVTLENAFVRLQVSRPSGRIHVFDKGAGRTIIEQSELIAEESAPGSWFDYHRTGRALPNVVDKIEVVENGAIRARLVIEGHIGQIPTRQNWFLYHDLAVVDILDELVWSHHPTPIMVQRTLPTDMKDPLVTYGVPFGANGWEEQQPKIGPHLGDEVSQEMYERIREVQHWIDFSTADHGVTVASDRRCIERAGGELRINLIYAGGDFAFFERHAHNTNRFSARTRLCAHPGDWRTGRSYRAGFSLLLPLVALSVADPLSSKSLAPVASLCQIPQDNIILTMIKCSEDGSATTLRGFEAEGRTTVASPSLLGSENRISETNLYEENPTSVNAVSWRPYEIKTLRIE